jgi:hypothetical protein
VGDSRRARLQILADRAHGQSLFLQLYLRSRTASALALSSGPTQPLQWESARRVLHGTTQSPSATTRLPVGSAKRTR